MALHSDFKEATWRGTTNIDGKVVGLSFDLADGSIVRLKIDLRDARAVSETIADYLTGYAVRTNSQPESSSGNPSFDVSPHEAEKV